MDLKLEGDKRYEEGFYDTALQNYEESLKIDPTNEYTLANIGLIYLRWNKDAQCLDFTNQAIERIDGFMNDTRTFSQDNKFEVKLLLRRASVFDKQDQVEKAKADLD